MSEIGPLEEETVAERLLPPDSGEVRLNELGYHQALKRDLTDVMSYSVALSLLATPLTITSLYTTGFYNGGPVVVIWGWLVVGFFSMFVVVSLAEILSSLPTAGGIYSQAYFLGGRRWGPLAAWWTGWLDWVAYVSGISALNFIFAQLMGVILLLFTNGAFAVPRLLLFGISSIAATVELLLNISPIKSVGIVQWVGAMWTVFMSIFLIVVIPAVAPSHQSVSYVFTAFIDNSAASGLNSSIYLISLGLLMSQFSLAGFEVNGHLSEETRNGDRNAAWGTIMSVLTTIVLGFCILLAITFSIQDPNNVLNPDNQTMGSFAAPQIYFDVFFARYGSGNIAICVIALVALCAVFANVGAMAAGSRLFWAMSRDGAAPFSSFFSHLTAEAKIPLPSILLTFVCSILFTLPVLKSSIAFIAINSFTTVATYLAYAIPILMKITFGLRRFEPGPLSLGIWSVPVNLVALLWICCISVMFCMPTVYPVSVETLNYAPVAFGCLFTLITIPWLLPKAWFNFQGPKQAARKVENGSSVRETRKPETE
eukprot:TRINITY_DN19232_c0_g1_i1.p1 TRINITY_DN19232_c0_g1~~TRINITY_DN19232_c0_g1_i1.p1  ORF type:complete len:539 (-),score=54.41 TRINITY_DN19232_c0_g1_i1:127-1743(-)